MLSLYESESDLNISNRSSITHEGANVSSEEQRIISDENLVASPSTESPEFRIDEFTNNHESADSTSADQYTRQNQNGVSHSLPPSHSEKLRSRLLEKLEPHRSPRSSWTEPRNDSLFRRVFHDRAISSSGKEVLKRQSERLAGESSIYADVNVSLYPSP